MNVSLRRQLDPGGFRFGMRKNQCVCVYQLWPWALSTYPSENGWQLLKASGDCTYGLKPLLTEASDHGRETSLLVSCPGKSLLEASLGKERKRSEWEKFLNLSVYTKKKKHGSDQDYLELTILCLLPFGRVEDKEQRETIHTFTLLPVRVYSISLTRLWELFSCVHRAGPPPSLMVQHAALWLTVPSSPSFTKVRPSFPEAH